MKVALITGSRRIGRFIIEEFLLKENYKVLNLSRNTKIRGVENLSMDLSRANYSRVGEWVSRFGRLDLFLHLASPYERVEFDELDERVLNYYFKVIVESFVMISKVVRPFMVEGGHIIAFGDWALERPYKGYTHYFIAKAGLEEAVRCLAKEFAPKVLVNCIALGPTLKAQDYTDEYWDRVVGKTLTKRPVSLKDLINLIRFLSQSDSITGETITLDGGKHLVL